MKYIYLIINSIALALILSACGTGDMSENADESITIAISSCNSYTPIQSGDTVVKDSDSTTIITLFNSDGSKDICIQSGNAHILRQGR